MEKTHAMFIRKFYRGAVFSLVAAFFLMNTAISASAVDINFDTSTGDSDSSQGNVSEEDCANLDENLAASVGCNTDDEIIDFTKYEGEFEGPEAEGYDDALTQTDNARDLVQTLVNFALSFLGLVATIMIIYGGVLYVTSRGDEEATSKGKKTITYAVIGIVIILASFAIVNTLIGATGGGNEGPGGDGTGTDTVAEAGSEFDVDNVLDELESVTEDFLEAYNDLLFVSQEVAFMQSIEMPLIVEVTEEDYSVGGFFDWIGGEISGTDEDFADEYTLIEEDDIEEYNSELRDGIGSIQREVDTLSDTYEAAQELYDYLRSGAASSSSLGLMEDLIPVAEAYASVNGCATREYNELSGGELSEGLGVNVYETNVSLIDDTICSQLDEIILAAERDYEENIDRLIDRVETLALLFEADNSTSGTLGEITGKFDDLVQLLEISKTTVNNNTSRDVLAAINDLFTLVENMEFVKAVLNASSLRGNAPLIVRFDALGSIDPSGKTVEDTAISWDLDGDGDFDDATGASTSFEYDEAGTYIVKLRVKSSDPNIAAGLAQTTVIVEPPSSVIHLTATAGGETTTLADFSKFPSINVENYKVTLNEATSAITFDASQSTDGAGNPLIFFEWDFGDGENVAGEGESTVQHLYGKPGRYVLTLTVTDSTGIQDRKITNIFVASPAARINVTPDSGQIGTNFTFSGAASTTDVGTIVSYQWSAVLNGQNYDLDQSTGSSINVDFDQPGIYTVTLTVTDSSGKQDSTSAEVLVESQTPDATFEYSVPNPTDPATYFFDATDSSDPDPQDVITFEWDFDGVEGDDFEIIDEENDGETITVRFLTPGKRDISLTVRDQHEAELQKSDTATLELNVDSVLDVEMELDEGLTHRLNDDGVASVDITARSNTATAFEIDFGDGETDFTDSISNNFASFTHEYGEAGVFYVELTALDDEGNENSVTRRIYVGAADSPIAVISIEADDQDVGVGETLTGNVKTKFTFDASNSVNTQGTNSGLTYTWNFGDGTISSQKTVTHVFTEHLTYNVTLTVKDQENPEVLSTDSIQIIIQGIDPEIRGLSFVPEGSSLITPLQVDVTVEAVDLDGDISFVKGWYYDLNDSATELGTVISQSTSFTLTLNTKGEEGDEVEYGFAVEVTDDDNRTVSSLDELTEAETPTLTVTNGPNDNPVAEFSVDKTSLIIGEEVHFSSLSYDPDGEIVEYVWDVEGDGFFNNTPQTEPSYTYSYSQIHTDGVEVQLRVTDSAGATATSETLTLYVDSISEPPDAAFLADVDGKDVQFINNSFIDEENGAELQGIFWDFDTDVDSNGNGVKNDDIDSLDEEPLHTYEDFETYGVKMTVIDSAGQTDSVERDVIVKETMPPVAAFTVTVDEKTVSFTNNSSTDEANDVDFREYIWDFDADTDSDGDGDEDNDSDSTSKNPEFTYEDFGTYEVKLTVVDSFGKSDSVSQNVSVTSSIQGLSALFTSVPAANSNGQIIMSGTSGDITFFFNGSGGSEDYSFEIDKNIFYDTEGDGVRDNDVDYSTSFSGSWKTGFDQSWGQIVVKLTVIDEETGEEAIDTLQVVFQGSLGGANLFNATPSEMLFLIASALLSATVGISLLFYTTNKSVSK